MLGVLAFFILLLTLYILSRIFIQRLFIFLFRIFKTRERATFVLGLIFLPGTFIHEMAHFLMALFLLVPVGRINLMPEVQERGIKLGSVEVGKTDFLRGSLIGMAPLIVGIGIIFFIISNALSYGLLTAWWVTPLLIYLIFQLTHTMFASRTDTRALLELLVFLIIVCAFLLLFKIYTPFTFLLAKTQDAGQLLQRLSVLLLIPIGVEITFLAMFRK